MNMTHWLGRAAHNVQSLLNRVALAYGSYPPVGPDYDPVPPRRLPGLPAAGPVADSA